MSWAATGRVLWCAALVGAVNLAACARSWPTVRGVADHEFAAHRTDVRTLDVLPLDVDFAVTRHAPRPVQEILERFHAVAAGALDAELARRGYRVTAFIDWDGTAGAPDGSVRAVSDAQAVADTAESLRSYGLAQSRARGELLFPFLPHRLGETTGSDATLYVGGWALVGKQRTSTGAKVAKGALIGAVVVIVIVAAIAGMKEGGGSVARGAGSVARAAGHAAGAIVRGAGRAVVPMARATGTAARVVARATPDLAEITLRTLDAFGRTHTHIEIYGGEPASYQRDFPREGDSRIEIEMTLVDNRTGRALWHARQQFDASAASDGDTAQVTRRMLASLPPAR